MFKDDERPDGTQEGKLQYCEISKARNKELYDLIAKLEPATLQEGITQLCTSTPRFRHALLETAPHYIYFNNGENDTLGVGENGMGRNDMGMALMEVRNELFRAKDAKHPLIVNTGELRGKARKERGEVDVLLGDENSKGKSIQQLRNMVSGEKKTKADAGARSPSPRGSK